LEKTYQEISKRSDLIQKRATQNADRQEIEKNAGGYLKWGQREYTRGISEKTGEKRIGAQRSRHYLETKYVESEEKTRKG